MQLRIVPWLLCLCLVGCESTEQPRSKSFQPNLTISPYHKIGIISHVDLNSATVVVKLDKSYPTLPTELYTRNKHLEITATLKPTGLRTDLSVGMIIIRGRPKIGHEVSLRKFPETTNEYIPESKEIEKY